MLPQNFFDLIVTRPKTDLDRLVDRSFAQYDIRHFLNAATDALFETEEEKLKKENLKLQNDVMRQQLPMDDDMLDKLPGSVFGAITKRGFSVIKNPKVTLVQPKGYLGVMTKARNNANFGGSNGRGLVARLLGK